MNSRQILLGIAMLCTLWHTANAQPTKGKIQVDAPPVQTVLANTTAQPNPVLSGLMAAKPEMPLGPADVLKSYELAMGYLADNCSTDFSVIVQAQQDDQISREQAEYLLLQRYQLAMMQYQVLSALHDVLKHDIDEAGQQENSMLKTTRSGTVVVVPFPASASAK